MNKHSRIYEKWWFWVIVGIVILLSISMITDSGDTTNAKIQAQKAVIRELCLYSQDLVLTINIQNGLLREAYAENAHAFEDHEALDCSEFL